MSLRFSSSRFVASLLLAVSGAMAQVPEPRPPVSQNGPEVGPPGSVPAAGPESPTPAPVPEISVPPPAPGTSNDELVGPIKLADADIDTVLGALEIYTGRTILRPQTLPTASTYTLKLNKPVPKSEAIVAIETLLALNGVGIAPLGDRFLKVVPLAQVKTEAPEIIDGSTLILPPSGRIATKLFQLDFLRVNEFVPQIAPLMSPGVANGIVSLDKANAALITDSISNLQRVETLLRQLDKPMANGLSPRFYTLKGGSKASDMVNKLRSLFQGPLASQLGTATVYSADDRTNQIILLADPRQYAIFDQLIAKLDIVAEPNTRNEVIMLKHATAKDVASILSQLVSGQNSASQKASGSNSVRPNQVVAATPGGQPVVTPAPGAALTAALGEPTNEFSGLITVLADDRSNAVVVSGTVDDIRLIKQLVDKLDILLAQVSIQVVVAEVTLSDTDVSGISALNLTVGPGADGRTMITNFEANNTTAASGGIAGWNISGGVVNPLAFQAALGNTGSRHNVKVLQSPTVVTTHAKEAKISVSQQLPVTTGVQTGLTSGGTDPLVSNQTVTYKDIGITLTVTPLIGDDGAIQLKIDQVVDDVIGNVLVNGNPQPIIGHREANSFVNVKDGQMVVLGGLQRNSMTRDRTKLGFLWEIPILSHIFGGRNHEVDRTELLLFIRPHVLNPEEGTADTVKQINDLANKEQVNQFLSDPKKQPKEPVIDKLK